MQQDETKWLPEPPSPRPTRRDAAIETALRRFDGMEEPASALRDRPHGSWAGRHRPQFAVLVSAMLLIVVGIPAALIGLRERPITSEQASPPAVAVQQAPCAGADCGTRAPAPPAPPAASGAPPVQQTGPSTRSLPLAAERPSAEVARIADRQSVAENAAPPVASAPPPAASVMTVGAPPPPPPPPPGSASREAVAQAGADSVIVTGSRIQNPALASPQGFDAKTARRSGEDPAAAVERKAYAAFLTQLQAAVRADDRRAIVAWIDFPLRVNGAGGTRVYADAEAVKADFGGIFTARVKRAILKQRPERLFIRDRGAMIGNGEVWLIQTCLNAACSPGLVRIGSINR